jgi:hypothetical protein
MLWDSCSLAAVHLVSVRLSLLGYTTFVTVTQTTFTVAQKTEQVLALVQKPAMAKGV